MQGFGRSYGCVVLVLIGTVLAGCSPATPQQPTGSEAPGPPPVPNRTLVLAGQSKTGTLAAKGLTNVGLTGISVSPFNAGLVLQDLQERQHPALATSLPQVGTDAWRVFPDGRMETTYQLKSGLTWHDGTPLAAEDFAFAWQVYATPTYGITAAAPPVNLIEGIDTPDAQTVVIRWKRPYADAGALTPDLLQPLPRHILQDSYERLSPDAFAALPFWSVEYVGLGPYRLTRWELNAFIQAEAFPGYVGGRPKIDQIKILLFTDTNTALANLLAGEAHSVAGHNAIGFEQAAYLMREWEASGTGSVVFTPGGIRRIENQFRPDVASPSYIMDLRVRRALAHAMDRNAINDAQLEGLGFAAEALLSPTVSYYAEVDRALMKYPYDLRRSEQLMNEAGLFKGPDGVYATPAEGRLNWEIKVLSNNQNEALMSMLADGWRRAGFEMTETVFPATQIDDREARAKFRTMFSTGGGTLEVLGSAGIPSSANRWTGSNRGGWSDAEYDRLIDAWSTALDRNERTRYLIQMARLYSEELGSTPVYFIPYPAPYVASLKGVVDADMFDIEHWEWVR